MLPPTTNVSSVPPSPFASGAVSLAPVSSRVMNPRSVYYTPAQISGTDLHAPSVMLYPQYPAGWRDIIGRAAAPLADEALRFGRAVKNWLWPQPAPAIVMSGSSQGVLPQTRSADMEVGAKTALMAGASALLMACGSGTHPFVDATFKVVGGLGLFFVGMKFLSDGMSTLSGSTMKRVLTTLTKNKFAAFVIGLLLTGAIQSSSITTTLCVGAAHAGMMDLVPALAVTLGAHIGTTSTGWLFVTKISEFGLPIIGLGAMPYVFSKSEKNKIIGMSAVGLGTVFLGLAMMSSGLGSPQIKEPLIQLLSPLYDVSYWGILKNIVCGLGVTLGIQSSSATLLIVMSMVKEGIMPYETAAAVVLGANMGTSITALLASRIPGTKTDARRVAWAHALFHAIGSMLVIYPMSPMFMDWSRRISESIFGQDPKTHVAMFHTLNNALTATIFLFALGWFVPLIKKMVPDKELPRATELGYGQRQLSEALLKTPEMALEASHGVIAGDMNTCVERTFDDILEVMSGKKTTDIVDPSIRIRENDLDALKKSVYHYLFRLEQRKLSKHSAATADSQRHIASNLERMGDHLFKIFEQLESGLPANLPAEDTQTLVNICQSMLEHFMFVSHAVAKNKPEVWSKVRAENELLKKQIAEQKMRWVQSSAEGQLFYNYLMTLYTDIIGNIKNIAEALAGRK